MSDVQTPFLPSPVAYWHRLFISRAHKRVPFLNRHWWRGQVLPLGFLLGLVTALVATTTPWIAVAAPLDESVSASFSPTEDKWIHEHNIVQVGVYAGDHMPIEGWIGGQPQGMGVDYAKLLASYAGLRLEFHPFTDWSIALGHGNPDSEFDLYVGQGVLPDLEPRFFLLRPYMTSSGVVVVRKDEQIIRRDSTFAGRRIAVERPLRYADAAIQKYYPGATLVFANDGSEALDLVAQGDADAYIGTGASRTRALLQRRKRDDLRMLGQGTIPSSGYTLAVPKDRMMLAQIMRKAESRVSQDDLLQLRRRWGIDETIDSLPPPLSALTSDQTNWLRSLPELRVAYETDRYPYSFVDEHAEFSGIAADYLHLLSENLGLKFKLVPAKDWNAVKELVANHQVDLIAAGSNNDFSSHDMRFSQPYETFPGVIVARVGGPPITGPADLSGRVVAIREEQSMVSRAKALLGASTLVPVGSNESGLAMVASGKADAYIGTLPAIDSLIRNRYAAELRVIGPAGIDLDLAVGLRPSDAALLPYINRELDGLTPAQRQTIRARWLTMDYYYGVPWKWVLLGLGSAVVLFGAGAFAYIRLRNASRAQTLAEKKLGNELSFQQALLETLPYPVFVKDAEGRYLAVNAAYEQLLHVSRSEILGHTLLETKHVTAPSSEELHAADQRVILVDENERIEIAQPHLPGEESIQSAISWRRRFVSSTSNEVRMLGTIVDISDIRSAEARARASEQRLSDITEAMPAVMFQLRVWAPGGRQFTYVGGDSKALLDLAPEEILGNESELAGRLHPDDRQRLLDHVHRAAHDLTAMAPTDFRLKVRGTWKWLRTEGGFPRRLPDGAAEWSGYWIDTTKAHQQEEELMHAKAQAESAVAAKGAFLAAMSHEIRTPMAGVVGLIELLTRTKVDSEQSNMLGMAQDSAKLLLQILDDILDYSRIEANRIDLETATFDIHQLIDSVVGVFSGGARDKGIRLHAIDDAYLAQLYAGDALRIRQIVTNLLSNALKFTNTGSITLRTLLLHSSENMHLLKFIISDTGIGIPAANLARLFSPFTQAEQSTTRRFGGTGLGLSISRRLAEMMGGKLYLKSKAGKGTDAIFEIPLPVVQAWEPPAKLVGRKATVITQDLLLEEELQRALSALGFDVSTTQSNAAVLESDNTPDIVFTSYDEARHLAPRISIPVVLLVPGEIKSDLESPQLKIDPVLWGPLQALCMEVLGLAEIRGEAPEAALPTVSDFTILVAEDTPINRAVISRQLEALGYPHTMVADGAEALAALSENHFDLLLADCHMPKMDGFELTRHIRQSEGNGRHLPIIALSASALPEQTQACLNAGMDGFLAKPATLKDLEAKLAPYAKPVRGDKNLNLPDGLDAQAAHLMSFYKDPVQLQLALSELLTCCHADLAELNQVIQEGNEARQRFLLHRIEGSLGVVGPVAEDAAPFKIGANLQERMDFIAERIALVEGLLRKLESDTAAHT